jgi:threonine dehydrogenase-like Zn-dependent dehydrogenase
MAKQLGEGGSMNIVIVGVGALGSHLVQFLRNTEAVLTIIDFDRVERHNVASQFHGKGSIGKMKANALKQAMQFFYGTKIVAQTSKVVENNVEQLLGSADLVIDCLDNGEGRRVIQDFVKDKGIPCLHGALAADGAYGRVCWTEFFVIDDEDGEGAATCEDGLHLPFIAVTASFLALAVQRYVSEGQKVGYQINPSGVIRI